MKIRAERKPLAETLAWVAQVIPKRPQMPALAGMRLTAADGQLTLAAFDYDSAHTAVVDVDVVTEGECLVSGAFLSQMVGAIKGDQVELVLDGGRLTISAGRSTYRTQPLRLEDYPSLPSFPPKVGTADADALGHLVATVQAPIDDESPFEQMRGLRLEGDEHELAAVGSTNTRVSVSSAPWTCEQAFAVTVPVRRVLTALKGMVGDVAIGHEDGLVGFSSGGRTVTLRTLALEYVDWRRVIRPAASDASAVEVHAEQLADIVKRAAMVSDDERLGLFIREDELEVSGIGLQGAGEGMEVLEISCTGSVSMGIHPRFLIDALAAVPSGLVSVGFVDGKKPLTIRPIDHPRMTFVVMPKALPGGLR